MRVWDIPVTQLCNKHLVAQHHEIHCIASIITYHKDGFANHPEVLRWKGLPAELHYVHQNTISEMVKRGMNHNDSHDSSGLHQWMHGPNTVMPKPWQPITKQKELLRAKGCGCKV